MRKTLLSAGLAGLALVFGLAAPASAADDTTVVTLTVVAVGGLTITAPEAANIGSGAEGGAVSGQIGSVTVLDQRASLTPNWTATVISTDFTTGGGTAQETIPNINVRYWSGQPIATSGSGTFTTGQPGAADAVIINVPRTVFTHTGGTGSNFATWNPTLVVTIPQDAVAGIYTGTVTHSVL
ncbi:hypothetical protein [Plantactinospora endophytica]|uniref:WxL domain-containing protein n=1 Tax=Plantactinospora endophytica TaxID=673535 RepID=A0ABQ4E788_9ACTN|nr:hypothetical protein [Plantactinospora endophytica]GIG90182.1 hypothetical protein Pen02_51180 [Plantactinospora endophytica]